MRDSLYAVLHVHLPQLRRLVDKSTCQRGVLCENLEFHAGGAPWRHSQELVFLFSLIRIGPDRMFATVQDISWSTRREQVTRTSEARLQMMMDGTRNCAIIPLDQDGTINYWSRSAERMLGKPNGAAIGQRLDTLFKSQTSPADTIRFQPLLRRCLAGENIDSEGWLIRGEQGAFWAEVSISRIEDYSGIHGITVVIRDGTHRRLEREALLRRAQRDPLTDLYNRAHFMALARAEIARHQRASTPLCIGMLDIDHFKSINDTWGHLAGDRVLQRVAHLCQQNLRNGDCIARYGGEEFVILFSNTTREGAAIAAERLRTLVANLSLIHISEPTRPY